MIREFQGRVFKKSSCSNAAKTYPYCVYVSISNDDVVVANLDDAAPVVARFSWQEWEMFINGVKRGEFDLP